MKPVLFGVLYVCLFGCPAAVYGAKNQGEVSPTSMFAILVAVGIVVAIILGANHAAQKEREEKEKARIRAEAQRRERVRAKYGQNEDAERIINKTVWVGETAEQLRDSIGAPEDIDEKVLKTKRKEIWKYDRKTATRFGLKFTLENDIVVGRDEKQ